MVRAPRAPRLPPRCRPGCDRSPGSLGDGPDPGGPRCSEVSRQAAEPMAGTAPRADVWVAVEHPPGWGDADLTRSGHGVRVLMVRGPRARPDSAAPSASASASPSPSVSASASPSPSGSPSASPSLSGSPSAPPSESGTEVDMLRTPDAGVRVWVGYATRTPTLRLGRVDRPDVVAGWDLADIAAGALRDWGRADPDPLLLVCANGRRDRCCGHSGGRLADALWRGPYTDRVLTCTHLGGHRFAPTALLLPIGALHGRLDEDAAAGLLTAATGGHPGCEHTAGSEHARSSGPGGRGPCARGHRVRRAHASARRAHGLRRSRPRGRHRARLERRGFAGVRRTTDKRPGAAVLWPRTGSDDAVVRSPLTSRRTGLQRAAWVVSRYPDLAADHPVTGGDSRDEGRLAPTGVSGGVVRRRSCGG